MQPRFKNMESTPAQAETTTNYTQNSKTHIKDALNFNQKEKREVPIGRMIGVCKNNLGLGRRTDRWSVGTPRTQDRIPAALLESVGGC